MNIFERINTALTGIGVPFAAEIYITVTGEDLPDQMIEYTVVIDEPEQFADNEVTEQTYLVQVNVFSRSGLTNLPDVDTVMKAAGFRVGRKVNLQFNQETKHYGRGYQYTYLETKE